MYGIILNQLFNNIVGYNSQLAKTYNYILESICYTFQENKWFLIYYYVGKSNCLNLLFSGKVLE